MTFPIPARLKAATLHHRLQAIAAATLAATSTTFGILLLSPQESLAANYCVYSEGRRVCLDSVFGPRAKRRIYFTVNGVLFVANKNCYVNDYQPSSITAVACWAYEALTQADTAKAAKEPENAKPAVPGEVVKALTTATEPAPSKTNSR